MPSRGTQLRYLVTVAEDGQITSAARRLKLAQPVLSQAIAQLESELGIELLERHARGVSLTPAGQVFLVKARAALAAEADAGRMAESLTRAATGALAVGFVGPPPATSTPKLFLPFATRYPQAQISYSDLPFPRGATTSWLADVDVAYCHQPALEPGVGVLAVRVEPRALVASREHPLLSLAKISTDDALEHTFVGYHPDVQPEWAGFHSLDDRRGGPPPSLTDDRALTSLQMLGIMAAMVSADVLTTVPHRDAQIAKQVLDLVAVPLEDIDPAAVSLIWRTDNQNPLVAALVETARELAVEHDGV